MSSPIVLTAFNPFGGRADNPSQTVVETLASQRLPWLVTEILRTEFDYAGARIRDLIAQHRPHAVVMLGLAERATGIQLERRAVNLTHARIPDNAGQQPAHAPIVPDAPPTYPSTLPLEALGLALARLGVPWCFSDDAGQYVCNHTFYHAADQLVRLNHLIPCGVIHLPDPAVLPLPQMIGAVRTCLDVLRAYPADAIAAPTTA